jgi:hypothetical protein
VAPVVTGVVTGTVSAVGIVATFKSGKQQVDAQIALAREDRQQARLERTCQQLMRFVVRRLGQASANTPVHGAGRTSDAHSGTRSTVQALVVTCCTKTL